MFTAHHPHYVKGESLIAPLRSAWEGLKGTLHLSPAITIRCASDYAAQVTITKPLFFIVMFVALATQVLVPSAQERLRGLVHQRFGQPGFVHPTKRTNVRTWDEVWAVLDVEPQTPSCGGKLHGWLIPQERCVILRGRKNQTFWVTVVKRESESESESETEDDE